MSIMGRIWLAAALSVAVSSVASAQGNISSLHSVSSYREQSAEYQVGYTTGLMDMFHWMVGDEPGVKNSIDSCMAGRGDVDISIMFDEISATGELDAIPGAVVFVDMLDGICGTEISNSVVLVAGNPNETSMSVFHMVPSYREKDLLYQTGYTSGMMDLVNWLAAKEPRVKADIDTCIEGKSLGQISGMFDTAIAGGDFDEFASAPVFVTMLNVTCGTQIAVRFDGTAPAVAAPVAGGRDAVAGAAEGGEGCTPVATLPEGLLLLLARTGQLTELYELGALC